MANFNPKLNSINDGQMVNLAQNKKVTSIEGLSRLRKINNSINNFKIINYQLDMLSTKITKQIETLTKSNYDTEN